VYQSNADDDGAKGIDDEMGSQFVSGSCIETLDFTDVGSKVAQCRRSFSATI